MRLSEYQRAWSEFPLHCRTIAPHAGIQFTNCFLLKSHKSTIHSHSPHGRAPQTPSQLASALQASSGRISTLLSSLEKKGWVTRDIDSKDRRIIRVNLTDSGREQSHRMIEEMRSAICWIFSQMGERRTREFVDLVSEFTTYMSICHPGRPRPTAEQVREAFVETSAWLNTWQLSARRTNRQG